ncbi:hypothetical protein [Streptomyces minutiscleroticus]|uniref:Uncharacterized protein n=1 Tax=Streptomyces minutiscleroticus TaxID=68238 RepID=A0A918U3E8_9ACTN|nr:hypothetical protein [Streptomyces minutiscleroticus]GGX86774.1 hypothetical protein GCM10010358_46030 [Streptomyces minutiscleroticus]
MSQPLPSLVTEAAAGSLAGARLRRYEMGPALIGAGADATVVIVVPGDNPGVSGVQDSTKVLLRGDRASDLHARFAFREPLPVHVFARLDQGCLLSAPHSAGERRPCPPTSTTPNGSSTARWAARRWT